MYLKKDSAQSVCTHVVAGVRGSAGRLSRVLWGGAGAPGGTVRRAAVRKWGSGSVSLRSMMCSTSLGLATFVGVSSESAAEMSL